MRALSSVGLSSAVTVTQLSLFGMAMSLPENVRGTNSCASSIVTGTDGGGGGALGAAFGLPHETRNELARMAESESNWAFVRTFGIRGVHG